MLFTKEEYKQRLKKEISLKKIERLVINKSLKAEYLKPYLGKPFKINE